MKYFSAAKTLYAFYAFKMFVWCSIVFGLRMHFANLNPLFDYRQIPFLQILMVLTGAVSLISLFKEKFVVLLITSAAALFIWDYAALGYFLKDSSDPAWIRVFIEAAIYKYVVFYIGRYRTLNLVLTAGKDGVK